MMRSRRRPGYFATWLLTLLTALHVAPTPAEAADTKIDVFRLTLSGCDLEYSIGRLSVHVSTSAGQDPVLVDAYPKEDGGWFFELDDSVQLSKVTVEPDVRPYGYVTRETGRRLNRRKGWGEYQFACRKVAVVHVSSEWESDLRFHLERDNERVEGVTTHTFDDIEPWSEIRLVVEIYGCEIDVPVPWRRLWRDGEWPLNLVDAASRCAHRAAGDGAILNGGSMVEDQLRHQKIDQGYVPEETRVYEFIYVTLEAEP